MLMSCLELIRNEEKMLVMRWQAQIMPDLSQVQSMLETEGLMPIKEIYPPGVGIETHSHAFDEVRVVVRGELLFDVAGNQLLLRAGDRVVIPANTKHSFKAQGAEDCLSFYAQKNW